MRFVQCYYSVIFVILFLLFILSKVITLSEFYCVAMGHGAWGFGEAWVGLTSTLYLPFLRILEEKSGKNYHPPSKPFQSPPRPPPWIFDQNDV